MLALQKQFLKNKFCFFATGSFTGLFFCPYRFFMGNKKTPVHKIFSFIKVLAFIAGCMALTFALVMPFWLFAVKAPFIYTVTVSLLALTGIISVIIKKIRAVPVAQLIFHTSRVVISTAGIIACIWLVFSMKRLFCLPVMILTFTLLHLTNAFIQKK